MEKTNKQKKTTIAIKSFNRPSHVFTLQKACEVHTHAHTHLGSCDFRAPVSPHRSLFFGEGPAVTSPQRNSSGAPFVRAGTPDPSLALITADQFDNLIDCEKDFFNWSSSRSHTQKKRKCLAFLSQQFERGAAKAATKERGEKERKSSRNPIYVSSFYQGRVAYAWFVLKGFCLFHELL